MYTFDYDGNTLMICSVLAKDVSSKAPRCSYLCKNVVATYVEEEGSSIVKNIVVSSVNEYFYRKGVKGNWTVIDLAKDTSHEALKEAVVKRLGERIHLYSDRRTGNIWRICLENDVYVM